MSGSFFYFSRKKLKFVDKNGQKKWSLDKNFWAEKFEKIAVDKKSGLLVKNF